MQLDEIALRLTEALIAKKPITDVQKPTAIVDLYIEVFNSLVLASKKNKSVSQL